MTTSYGLPDPDPNSQLIEPSHASLHTSTNSAIQDIANRLVALEGTLTQATAPDGAIEQARLVANTWDVAGTLTPAQTNKVLLPVIWNLGGRAALFYAAKASVFTPPVGGEIHIDIIACPSLVTNVYDLSGDQDTVLQQQLVIPAGQHVSTTAISADFLSQHSTDTWVSAVITQVGPSGGDNSPGADLTIQLNRLL